MLSVIASAKKDKLANFKKIAEAVSLCFENREKQLVLVASLKFKQIGTGMHILHYTSQRDLQEKCRLR